jgi:SAM-dependent methyltransferase
MEHEVYDAFYRAEDAHWWFMARRRLIRAVLERLYPAGGLEIADVGCGTGGMMELLGRYGRVTGVDEAPEAREYCARRGFSGVLTPAEWALSSATYDLITAFDVVEHIEDDHGFLRQLRTRIRPGGRLLVTVPAYPFLWSRFDEMNHHHRRYTRGPLDRALAGAGFEIERSTYFNMLLFPPVAAVRLVEKVAGSRRVGEDHERALERWFKVGPLNGFLETVFALERFGVVGAGFPFGTSILAIGRNHGS